MPALTCHPWLRREIAINSACFSSLFQVSECCAFTGLFFMKRRYAAVPSEKSAEPTAARLSSLRLQGLVGRQVVSLFHGGAVPRVWVFSRSLSGPDAARPPCPPPCDPLKAQLRKEHSRAKAEDGISGSELHGVVRARGARAAAPGFGWKRGARREPELPAWAKLSADVPREDACLPGWAVCQSESQGFPCLGASAALLLSSPLLRSRGGTGQEPFPSAVSLAFCSGGF